VKDEVLAISVMHSIGRTCLYLNTNVYIYITQHYRHHQYSLRIELLVTGDE